MTVTANFNYFVVSYFRLTNIMKIFFLDFSKFATWTHVEEGMPEYFQNEVLETEAKSILAEVPSSVARRSSQVARNEQIH